MIDGKGLIVSYYFDVGLLYQITTSSQLMAALSINFVNRKGQWDAVISCYCCCGFICSCDCCTASYIVLKILKGQDSSVPYGVDKG